MRVALIGPVYPYRGGIAHYTTLLYREMKKHKHDFLLVSFKRQYPRWLFPGDSDRDPSARPEQVEDAQYWIDSLNPWTWIQTFSRIRTYQPDVIVLQWWTVFWVPVWFCLALLNRLFMQAPLLFICHNVLPHETRIWDRWLAVLVLRWGKSFIVSSESERARLLSLLPKSNVTTVPLPSCNVFTKHRIPKDVARKKLGLPPSEPVVLFFGIVRQYKGLMDLINAMPIARKHFQDIWLLITGDFWDDKQPYLNTITRSGIVDHTIVTDGYVSNEDAALHFSAADVLVAPYRRATGSAVVQTARDFGIPVITTIPIENETEDADLLLTEPGNIDMLGLTIAHFFRDQVSDRSAQTETRSRTTSGLWSRVIIEIERAAGETHVKDFAAVTDTAGLSDGH
jgi:glycosyltransferase involved in cell wall biosynthesis